MTLPAVALVVERKKGLVERATVAGVNFSEVIIATIITRFVILVIQVIFTLIIDIYILKVGLKTLLKCVLYA